MRATPCVRPRSSSLPKARPPPARDAGQGLCCARSNARPRYGPSSRRSAAAPTREPGLACRPDISAARTLARCNRPARSRLARHSHDASPLARRSPLDLAPHNLGPARRRKVARRTRAGRSLRPRTPGARDRRRALAPAAARMRLRAGLLVSRLDASPPAGRNRQDVRRPATVAARQSLPTRARPLS